MKLLRIVARVLLVLIAVVIIAAAGGYFWLRGALPSTSGTITVEGIASTVTITRDADAVPHIRAQNEADALFGLGYVHAQDRLWQMEFQRRVGFGRLSEVLGEPALKTDRFLRTLGTGRAAERAWANMPAEDKPFIEAYVKGVNSFVATHHGRELPLEFTLLGFEPAPWQPADVLVWAKMMAYNLGGNWEDELLRASLSEKLGPERTAQLMPAYGENDPLILGSGSAEAVSGGRQTVASIHSSQSTIQGQAEQLITLNHLIQESLGLGGKHIGSNNWVIGGARTTTGKPLLANDPHLGTQVPSIWYLAHVTGGSIDAIGATLPGLPGVVIGHNNRIAWGVTNTGPDTQDLYIERIDAENRAEYKGQMEPMQIVYDTIKVKGRPEEPIAIRITRHGPIISDVVADVRQPLALRWTALDEDDNTFPAFLRINRAQNWQEFTAALQNYSSPMQNFVYADVDGNIGYYAPGKLPIRAAGDGSAPVPGWTGEYDWQGYVPLDELPHTYNPPEGYIATANNRVVGDNYRHFIGSSFAAPYRALRIHELINAKPQLSPDDVAAIQADITSAQARELLPKLLEIQPQSDRAKAALELLRRWDGAMRGESAEAAIYAAWYQAIPSTIISDELGADLMDSYGGAASDFFAIAAPSILRGEGNWCNDTRTAASESCDQQLGAALEQGLDAMSQEQGSTDINTWRWNKAHHTYFPHQPLDSVGALRPIVSRSIPNGGDKFTVDVAPVRASDFDQRHVPSYREIIDLSNLGASRFMNTLGQSGSPLSGDYANLLDRWQKVEYLPMRYDEASIEQGQQGTLTLEAVKR